jgi:hypothetical protein
VSIKRIITVFGVVLVIVLAAAAVAQAAATATSSQTQTFSLVGETVFLTGDGCVGENIRLTSGALTVRSSLVTTSSGRIVTTFQLLYKSVSGVGTSSGTKYQIQDVERSVTTAPTDPGHWQTTLATTGLRVVGPGPDNNRWATLVIHVSGDSATGQVAVEFEHFGLACR